MDTYIILNNIKIKFLKYIISNIIVHISLWTLIYKFIIKIMQFYNQIFGKHLNLLFDLKIIRLILFF
jgi:hypothetical protein